ncbi:MAG: glycosyltransferase family 2 protein [Deltaproteobacteria bacterium]|nr:glycosyltransferase family 2 protein [Deltaproteobacteria bacterium]
MSISVVINTLNEEANIADCIRSVQWMADEVVVCDMHSDDRTLEIAQSLGAHVIYYERTGFVEPARYFAISQAQHEWVLVIDADERMTERLATKLRELARDKSVEVVSFWSLYWYFGDWVRYGEFFSNTWTRFFRKEIYLETYNSNEENVHHNFDALRAYPNNLRLGPEHHILHLAYPTIEKYVCKTLGMYARVEGEQYYKQGRRFSFVRMVGEPLKSFVKTLFLMQGYRDGMRGFILSVLYAGYRFNTWANVWLLEELDKQKNSSKREAI